MYSLKTKLVDIKDSLTVIEGKEGVTRSILGQYCVYLGLLLVLEQGESKARESVWGCGT